MAAFLGYHETNVQYLLILSSFLLVINIIGYAFNKIIYCGLIAKLSVGVAQGSPGANVLSAEVENTVFRLGNIGLILVVYEGTIEACLLKKPSPGLRFNRFLILAQALARGSSLFRH